MKSNCSSSTTSDTNIQSPAPANTDHLRRHFTVAFLEQISRSTLESFFQRYSAHALLRYDGPDHGYYFHLRCAFAAGIQILTDLTDALRAIHQMSSADAHHRLTTLLTSACPVQRRRLSTCTPAELAMHAWLEHAQLFAQAETQAHLLRLTLFTYYGAAAPRTQTGPLDCPPRDILDAIQSDLDTWFAAHYRGEETVHLQVHDIDDEFWFLIRHGDIFARQAAVERCTTEILRFRPAKDDVVVYTPERNELRIHAGTVGETELYRQSFGHRLFGNPDYFCEHNAYTLEPLRMDGPRALDVTGIRGIAGIRLAEVELKSPNGCDDTMIHKFGSRPLVNRWPGIPHGGELMRAVFDIRFNGPGRAKKVEICPPNQLRLGRHCNIHLIQRWLTRRGFRAATRPKTLCAVNF